MCEYLFDNDFLMEMAMEISSNKDVFKILGVWGSNKWLGSGQEQMLASGTEGPEGLSAADSVGIPTNRLCGRLGLMREARFRDLESNEEPCPKASILKLKYLQILLSLSEDTDTLSLLRLLSCGPQCSGGASC